MSDRNTPDLETLKRSANIEDVIGGYVELKQDGREFEGLCPFHGEKTPSFYVVPEKGFYHCFGCGAHGDVIDFLVETNGINRDEKGWLAEVARLLGADPGERPAPPARPRPAAPEPQWRPIIPVPDDAPALIGDDGWTVDIYNPKRAGTDKETTRLRPVTVDAYCLADGALAGYVLRCEWPDDDGKTRKFTPQVTWCEGPDGACRWALVFFPEPRPLLGLDALAARPDDRVVLVEGEKARRAAAELLPSYVAVTWPGGSKAVSRVAWTPLRGRKVLLWPDADKPGAAAGEAISSVLGALGCTLRVVGTDGQPDGWDAADALAEGWDTRRTVEWLKSHVRAVTPPPEAQRPEPPPATPVTDPAPRPARRLRAIDGGKSTDTRGNAARAPDAREQQEMAWFQVWDKLNLDKNGNGAPLTNLNNATRVLEAHPLFRGHVWFDEFHQKYFTDFDDGERAGEVREWSDNEDLKATLYMQRALGLSKMSDDMVHRSLILVARRNVRNEPRDWMESLTWDGQERVATFLPTYFGAKDTEYTRAAARNFWIGMIARVFSPGCKVDNMLVLEADQGAGKSSALAVIGGKWYAEAHESVMSKDFYMTLQGKLLVEIGEMDAFSRAEANKVKQVITCTTDRFRAPYERAAQDYPRHNIFAGTTNDDAYLRDPTGGRRFWPVRCGKVVDGDLLALDREQLFAEAVELYRSGEPWWYMPVEETRAEQESRRVADVWEEAIGFYLATKKETTLADVLEYGLSLETNKIQPQDQNRAARALRSLGWENTAATRDGKRIKIWRPRREE